MKIISSLSPKIRKHQLMRPKLTDCTFNELFVVKFFCSSPLEALYPGFKQANLYIFKIYFYLVKADWAWTEHSTSSSYGPTHSHPSNQSVSAELQAAEEESHVAGHFFSIHSTNQSKSRWKHQEDRYDRDLTRGELQKMTASQTCLLYIHSLIKK